MGEGTGNISSNSGIAQERVYEHTLAIVVSTVIKNPCVNNIIPAEGEEIKTMIHTDLDLKCGTSDRFNVSLADSGVVAGLIIWVIVESQNLTVRDYLNIDTLKRIHV